MIFIAVVLVVCIFMLGIHAYLNVKPWCVLFPFGVEYQIDSTYSSFFIDNTPVWFTLKTLLRSSIYSLFCHTVKKPMSTKLGLKKKIITVNTTNTTICTQTWFLCLLIRFSATYLSLAKCSVMQLLWSTILYGCFKKCPRSTSRMNNLCRIASHNGSPQLMLHLRLS